MARPSLNDLRRMFYGADTDESASDAEWEALEAAYAAGTSFSTLLDAYNSIVDVDDLPVGSDIGDESIVTFGTTPSLTSISTILGIEYARTDAALSSGLIN